MMNKNYLISLMFLICVNVLDNIKCMYEDNKDNKYKYNEFIKGCLLNGPIINNRNVVNGTRVINPQFITQESFKKGQYDPTKSFIIINSSSRWQKLDKLDKKNNNNNNNNNVYPKFDIKASNNHCYDDNNQNSLEKYKDDQNEQKNKQLKVLIDFINKNPNVKIKHNYDLNYFVFESFCAKITVSQESFIYGDLKNFYNSMLKNQLAVENNNNNNNQIVPQKNSLKSRHNNNFFTQSTSLNQFQNKHIEPMYQEINNNNNKSNNNKLALSQPPVLKQNNSQIEDLLGFIPRTEEKTFNKK
jgi:hypothetical protein